MKNTKGKKEIKANQDIKVNRYDKIFLINFFAADSKNVHSLIKYIKRLRAQNTE